MSTSSAHKIAYSKSGVNSGYWNARCACGWRSTAWTHRKSDVVSAKNSHLLAVKNGAREYIGGVLFRDWSSGDKAP